MSHIGEALVLLANRDDMELRVLQRYGRGETGAYRVVDAGGRYFALKFASPKRVAQARLTTDRLRQVGYPAPFYETTGELEHDLWYALIGEIPGHPVRDLSVDLVEQLLALVEKQARNALFPVDEPRIIDTLLHGGDGYALHETMRSYSSVTSELLDAVIGIGQRFESLDYPSEDVVHYDFNPANLLILDGSITGVVDWESTGSGDRAFDIATLLFYGGSEEAAETRLWQALLDLTGPNRAAVYLAHMILRQVEWSARHHGPTTVAKHVDRSTALLTSTRKLG